MRADRGLEIVADLLEAECREEKKAARQPGRLARQLQEAVRKGVRGVPALLHLADNKAARGEALEALDRLADTHAEAIVEAGGVAALVPHISHDTWGPAAVDLLVKLAIRCPAAERSVAEAVLQNASGQALERATATLAVSGTISGGISRDADHAQATDRGTDRGPIADPVPDVATENPPASPPASPPTQSTTECCVCMEEVRVEDVPVLVPCGHRRTCGECAKATPTCPICRCKVGMIVKVYS